MVILTQILLLKSELGSEAGRSWWMTPKGLFSLRMANTMQLFTLLSKWIISARTRIFYILIDERSEAGSPPFLWWADHHRAHDFSWARKKTRLKTYVRRWMSYRHRSNAKEKNFFDAKKQGIRVRNCYQTIRKLDSIAQKLFYPKFIKRNKSDGKNRRQDKKRLSTCKFDLWHQ